ncbi:MAG: 50S ribosomal protein L7/L12 [Treponema sp.]|jgi:large subunit ribosomal protein L7/L12|nr:50S ribosomal protein L7/L12 [Treponema sp.]
MAALTNDQILEAIASMSVLEVSELVKAMEEKFGVTAAVAVAAAPVAGAAAAEEQTEFTVTLDSFDAAKKIPVIKVIREITGLGLGEAKALVEGAPKEVKEGVSKADADEMVKKITEAGGKASKK